MKYITIILVLQTTIYLESINLNLSPAKKILILKS